MIDGKRIGLIVAVAAGLGFVAAAFVVFRDLGPPPVRPDPALRAESPADLEAAEAALRRVEATLAQQSCARPVLRGETSPGDGSAALHRLLGDDSPVRACLAIDHATVDAVMLGNELDGSLYGWAYDSADYDDRAPYGSSLRGFRVWPVPPYPSEHLPAPLTATLEACAGLPEAIDEVLGHASVCSPWRVGVGRFEEGDVERVSALASGIRVLARARVRAGEGAAAIELLLAGVRLFHDLGRGGVGMTAAVVASSGQWKLLNELQALAMLDLSLDPASVERLRGELDRLYASHPPVGSVIAAELVLHGGWAAAQGEGRDRWAAYAEASVELDGVDPSGAVELLVAAANLSRSLEPSCLAADSSDAGCYDRLANLWEPLLGGIVGEGGRQLILAKLDLRAARALLGFAAVRDAGEACPGRAGIPDADLELPGFEGGMNVAEVAPGRLFELWAPQRMLPSSERETRAIALIGAHCPGLPLAEAGVYFENEPYVEPGDFEADYDPDRDPYDYE